MGCFVFYTLQMNGVSQKAMTKAMTNSMLLHLQVKQDENKQLESST